MLFWSTLVGAVFAATAAMAQQNTEQPVADRAQLKKLSRYFLNAGIEPPRPFRPVRRRTVADERRLEAIAWFCTGRRLVHQRRWRDAVAAYKKALQFDPKGVAIYHDLIRLLRLLGREQELHEYLARAVEVDPENHEFLYQLALETLRSGELDTARDLLERALQSPRLPETSYDRLRIALTLAEVFDRQQRYKAAAEQYAFVLNALAQPRRYRLYRDPRARVLFRDLPGLYERIGNALRRAQRYELALEAYRRAREAAGAQGARFYLKIAETYLDADKPRQALEALEHYIREQTPQGAEAYELLVRVLEQLGRQEEIIPRLQEALERDPHNRELRLLLAARLEKAGRADEAEAIYQQLLGTAPSPKVVAALAALHWRRGAVAKSLELLGQLGNQLVRRRSSDALAALAGIARELAGDEARYREAMQQVDNMLAQPDGGGMTVGLAYALARVAKVAKDYDRCVKLLTHCRDRSPANPVFVIELHETLMAAKRYAEAAENLRWALEKGPWALNPSPVIYAELARALLLAGKLDDAYREARRVIELMPHRASGYALAAFVLIRRGKYEEAIKLLEEARKAVRGNPSEERRVLLQLSSVYYEANNLAKTEEILLEVIRRWPQDPGAYNDLGYIWADHDKNLDQAERFIRRALELYERQRSPQDPEKNAAYLDSLGWVLYKKGRYEEARKYLEEAAHAPEGDDGVIWDHLGDVYWSLGQRKEAIQAWEKAARLLEKEDSPTDRKRLEEVRSKLQKARQNKPIPELRPATQAKP